MLFKPRYQNVSAISIILHIDFPVNLFSSFSLIQKKKKSVICIVCSMNQLNKDVRDQKSLKSRKIRLYQERFTELS